MNSLLSHPLGNGFNISLLIILEMNIILLLIWIMIHILMFLLLEGIIGEHLIVMKSRLMFIQEGSQVLSYLIMIVMEYLELIIEVDFIRINFVHRIRDMELLLLEILLVHIFLFLRNSSMWPWCRRALLKICFQDLLMNLIFLINQDIQDIQILLTLQGQSTNIYEIGISVTITISRILE